MESMGHTVGFPPAHAGIPRTLFLIGLANYGLDTFHLRSNELIELAGLVGRQTALVGYRYVAH